MLVLTRKLNERLVIRPSDDWQPGDAIVMTIVEIRGGRVRLSIDGPRSIVVLRDELETSGATR